VGMRPSAFAAEPPWIIIPHRYIECTGRTQRRRWPPGEVSLLGHSGAEHAEPAIPPREDGSESLIRRLLGNGYGVRWERRIVCTGRLGGTGLESPITYDAKGHSHSHLHLHLHLHSSFPFEAAGISSRCASPDVLEETPPNREVASISRCAVCRALYTTSLLSQPAQPCTIQQNKSQSARERK